MSYLSGKSFSINSGKFFFFTRKQKLSIIDKIKKKKIQLKKTYFKKGLRNSKHWSWNDGWGSNFYSRWNIPFSLKYTTQSKLWGFQIVSFEEWLEIILVYQVCRKWLSFSKLFCGRLWQLQCCHLSVVLNSSWITWHGEKKQKAIWYFHYFSWAISLRKIIFCFTVSNESPAVSCIPYWFFFHFCFELKLVFI